MGNDSNYSGLFTYILVVQDLKLLSFLGFHNEYAILHII